MARKRPEPAPGGPVALRILRDHDYRHAPALITAFRAGTTVPVAPEIAERLIAAGVAETQHPHSKENENG